VSLSTPINLIPLYRQIKAERNRRMRWWIGLWSGYAGVLIVLVGLLYLHLGTSRDLTHDLKQQDQQLSSLQNDTRQTQTMLLQVSQKLLSARGLLEQPDWSQLLAVLADLRGNDVVLEDVNLQLTAEAVPAPTPTKSSKSKAPPPTIKTKWNLQLEGHGKTPESVSQYVLRLEATQLFDQVNLLKTNRDPIGAGEAISFSIQCPIKGRGRAPQ
jgi:hypothetical protein